jgi:hypothetical protein
MENKDRTESNPPKPGGMRYFVTDDQIHEHQQRSISEILEWIESTNEFLYRFQSPEARQRWMQIRKGEF